MTQETDAEKAERWYAQYQITRQDNERLVAKQNEVIAWIKEGEGLFETDSIGAAFRAGVWWADRPWRKR